MSKTASTVSFPSSKATSILAQATGWWQHSSSPSFWSACLSQRHWFFRFQQAGIKVRAGGDGEVDNEDHGRRGHLVDEAGEDADINAEVDDVRFADFNFSSRLRKGLRLNKSSHRSPKRHVGDKMRPEARLYRVGTGRTVT
ncbi:hypothetical protein Cni_G17913 [Canna indica]|uniref:Uncharacterized protein n=1 Tax=Canna indica TaxID=4628 RepID=A0AAQ3KI88_9LILI|nr:hypothetical protein Cni_G17913 [Canna indica]